MRCFYETIITSFKCFLCIFLAFLFMQKKFLPLLQVMVFMTSHSYLNQDIIDKVGELNKEWSETTLKPQIAVAVVDSLDKDIESVANETARAWKVRVILVQITESYWLLLLRIRKSAPETSNNLSTLITDSKASALNRTVKSDFRRGAITPLCGVSTIYLYNSLFIQFGF